MALARRLGYVGGVRDLSLVAMIVILAGDMAGLYVQVAVLHSYLQTEYTACVLCLIILCERIGEVYVCSNGNIGFANATFQEGAIYTLSEIECATV